MLEIEPGTHVVETVCDHCQEPMTRATGFVLRDGDAYAIYFASCHHHDGHEVWIDAVFSPTWAEEVDDRITFGCRVGAVEGQEEPAACLVAAAAAFRESRTFGRKLARHEASTHPLIGEFWALVDHVPTKDKFVSGHMYGPGAQFE